MAAFLRLIKKKQDNVSGSELLTQSFPSGQEGLKVVEGGTDKPNAKRKTNNEGAVSAKDKKPEKELAKNSAGNGRPELRSKRLMKEFLQISKSTEESSEWFTAELVEDSLYEWNIMLFSVDPESELHQDMKDLNVSHILLNLSFPDNFPFSPPFMRVVRPKIEGGFILDGGAICMELLTPSGWSSAYTVEAIIMQFAALIVKGRGRIDKKSKSDFTRKEAEASFKKLVKTHERYGWITPPMSEG